jgi:hypothetical protein
MTELDNTLKDIVPALHFLRSLLSEEEKSDETSEIAATQEKLAQLELLFENYDNLHVIMSIKQKLCDYVSSTVLLFCYLMKFVLYLICPAQLFG